MSYKPKNRDYSSDYWEQYFDRLKQGLVKADVKHLKGGDYKMLKHTFFRGGSAITSALISALPVIQKEAKEDQMGILIRLIADLNQEMNEKPLEVQEEPFNDIVLTLSATEKKDYH